MEKLRLGIIGCGKMMRAHVESLSEVEEVEITNNNTLQSELQGVLGGGE